MTHPTVENLSICWDSLTELLPTLDDNQWATQSLCPDWSVHEVVRHLAAIEHILVGWSPDGDAVPAFGDVEAFMADTAALSGAELIERFIDITDERRTDFAGMDEEYFNQPSFTPVGTATYGSFMAVRVFDFWVHEQDIRRPLGLGGHEAGPAAEMAMDQIESSLGYIVGKKVGLPDGMSITINTIGGVERTMHVKVDGRAQQVANLDDPTVTLEADSTVFALLACGRIDPQAEIDAGTVSWTGDDEWGDKAARGLRFTM